MKITEKVVQNLNEISHGSIEVRFAYIDPATGNTITPFCRCKDYFNDMFWSLKTKKPVDCCGFTWDSNDKRNKFIEGDTLTIAIKLSRKGNSIVNLPVEEKHLYGIEKLFKEMNRGLKYRPIELSLSDDGEHIILSYDRRWSEIPYLNSAFFLFIRLGLTYEGEDIVEFFSDGKSQKFMSPHDIGYFKAAREKIENIIEGKLDTHQKYEDYPSDSYVHSNSGLVYYRNYKID